MSYDLCVFKPDYTADRDALHEAWNYDKYWAKSLADHDRTAAKWRTKDLLMGFDERLRWHEPRAPKTGLVGLFAKWFGKPSPVRPYLQFYLDDDDGQTGFDVFDEVIEISLPWDSPHVDAEKKVRELWRFLEHLSASDWSTIYDTERDVLLNLATDKEAVTARYRENLGPEKVAEPPSAGASSRKPVPARAPAASAKDGKPFSGNVD